MPTTTNNDPFEGMQEQKTQAIKWGKIGDWVKGTIVANDREVPNTLNPDKHEMQHILELKVHGGSFHGINEDKTVQEQPTVLEAGSFWSVFLKPGLWNVVRNAKLGQVIGFRFTEELKPKVKGYNPTKVIKPYLGAMDPTYTGEQGAGMVPLDAEE